MHFIADRPVLLTQAMLTGQSSNISSTMLRDMEPIKNKAHFQIIHTNFRTESLSESLNLLLTIKGL